MNLMFSELGFSLYVHWVWSDIVCSTEQMESLLPVNLLPVCSICSLHYTISGLHMVLFCCSHPFSFPSSYFLYSLPLLFLLSLSLT